MSRLTWIGWLALGLALAGCQKAKMTGVQPTPTAVQALPPPTPVILPPPPVNPPPQEVYPYPAPVVLLPPTVVTYPQPTPVHVPAPCPTPAPPPRPIPQRQDCRVQSLGVKSGTPKVDILFVLDTSASMRGGTNRGVGGELGQLARDMHYFMASLDPNIDARIGVMLGHGPADAANHGRLYSADDAAQNRGARNSKPYPKLRDPYVIDYQAVRKQFGGDQAKADAYVGSILENKVVAMPSESGGAQGEALLLSVYDAMTNGSLRQEIQNQGLLRQGVPLAVILVSDEQDVCYDYAANGKTPTVPDPIETKFFNEVCSRAVNGGPLTPDAVYDALASVSNNVIIGGLVYQNYVEPNTKYASNGKKISQDDNEQGWGYLDLVQRAQDHGLVIDLATVDKDNPDFWRQMQTLGQFTETQRKITNRFYCAAETDPRLADPNSVEVCITDANNQPVALFSNHRGSNTCQATQLGGLAWAPLAKHHMSRVTVDESALRSLNLDGGYVHISFVPSR